MKYIFHCMCICMYILHCYHFLVRVEKMVQKLGKQMAAVSIFSSRTLVRLCSSRHWKIYAQFICSNSNVYLYIAMSI
jgi:hypothetical protein